MRMIIGLDAPTHGTVTVKRAMYAEHRAPLHEVGTLLEAKAMHNGRSARNHLLVLAATCGISTRRVDELLYAHSVVSQKRSGSVGRSMGRRQIQAMVA